jgi:hypothetical protein
MKKPPGGVGGLFSRGGIYEKPYEEGISIMTPSYIRFR